MSDERILTLIHEERRFPTNFHHSNLYELTNEFNRRTYAQSVEPSWGSRPWITLAVAVGLLMVFVILVVRAYF